MSIQTEADRRKLSAEWARLGGGFTVEPGPLPVDIEDLLVRSVRQAPADHRLFFVAATWLGVHHQLVDMRRLGRMLADQDGMDSAVAGALLSVANEIAGAKRLETAMRHCRPLAEPRVLFERTASHPVLGAFAREHALPLFVRWGLWHDEISLKLGAVRPIRWILLHCPELRLRALLGAGLESEIAEALREAPRTVAELARISGASYAATHEACSRLIARGLVEASSTESHSGLALSEPFAAWFNAFPDVVRSVQRTAA
ncbi:hypothetical protein BH23GEM7_BH23GEM7_28400 [soil metagenome]|nr:hypothetical protein [Gemmatimonadota bacterium]